MSSYTPEWQVFINSVEYTDVTLVGVNITAGRSSLETQANPSTCSLELINLDNSNYNFSINDELEIKLKKTNGAFHSVFKGTITDLTVGVRSAGTVTYVTSAQITAIGFLAKLAKNVWSSTGINKAYDGTQINTVLSTASGITIGSVDTPGSYELIERQNTAPDIDYYSLCTEIANSGAGYLYEKGDGSINYGDAYSRSDYYTTFGLTSLDARQAYANGLRTTIRSGDIRNSIYVNYGNNNGSQLTVSNTSSISTYGLFAESVNTLHHDSTAATNWANFKLGIRSVPRPNFESISFPLSNPEIDDADRDALITVFMGLGIEITNLPANLGSTFSGFVERYSIKGSLGNVTVTLEASPLSASVPPQRWQDVTPTLKWSDVSATLTWIDANGVLL